jgi:hypothetical protein
VPAPAMSCTASRKASALVEYLQYQGAEQYQGQYQLGAHSTSWEPDGTVLSEPHAGIMCAVGWHAVTAECKHPSAGHLKAA